MAENSGSRWPGRLRRAPLWAGTLVFAAIWSAAMLGMDFLQDENLEPADLVATGAGGLVVAAVALWFGRSVQAKELKLPPGSPTATNIKRAISTGQLPEQASAEQWGPELRKIIRHERRMVWIGLLEFGLFTALGIFLIVDRPGHPWFGVVCTALFLGIAICTPFWVRRRRARIRSLLAQLPITRP
jgi:hypothetical protein